MSQQSNKILQINSSSDAGGGPQIMWDIIQGLKNDFSFEILSPDGLFLKHYQKIEIPTEVFDNVNIFKKIKKIREIITRKQFLIIHAHGTRAAFWTRLAGMGIKNKPKLLYTLHGLHIIKKPFFLKWILLVLEKFLNRYTDVLICVSDADKSLVFKYNLILPQKIRVIKNGIDIQRFNLPQDKIIDKKQEMGLTNNFVLISIARLHPQKDVATIVTALQIVIKKIPEAKLLIVGDGPLRKELKENVISLGLERYVDFLGTREDVPILIALSDIVLFSTNWEALGLVQLEAGASKKPAIVSNVLGVRETIKNNETGFLFDPGSEKDLADKVLMLYESKELREKIGNAAFEFVCNNFSKERMIKEHKILYNSLL